MQTVLFVAVFHTLLNAHYLRLPIFGGVEFFLLGKAQNPIRVASALVSVPRSLLRWLAGEDPSDLGSLNQNKYSNPSNQSDSHNWDRLPCSSFRASHVCSGHRCIYARIFVPALAWDQDGKLIRSSPSHWFKKRAVETGQAVRPEALDFCDDGFQVITQLTDFDTAADIRPRGDPFLDSPIHLDRAAIVGARDVQVNYRSLQNGAVEFAHGSAFFLPGFFQVFVRQPVFPGVE